MLGFVDFLAVAPESPLWLPSEKEIEDEFLPPKKPLSDGTGAAGVLSWAHGTVDAEEGRLAITGLETLESEEKMLELRR